MKNLLVVSVFGIAFSVAGCATVTQGTTDVLLIESTPQNAQVLINSGETCSSTPCAIELPKKTPVTVEISKAGCETRRVNVLSQMSTSGGAAVAGNLLVGGVIGLGVDAATGASKELTPNPVVVTLDC